MSSRESRVPLQAAGGGGQKMLNRSNSRGDSGKSQQGHQESKEPGVKQVKVLGLELAS